MRRLLPTATLLLATLVAFPACAWDGPPPPAYGWQSAGWQSTGWHHRPAPPPRWGWHRPPPRHWAPPPRRHYGRDHGWHRPHRDSQRHDRGWREGRRW